MRITKDGLPGAALVEGLWPEMGEDPDERRARLHREAEETRQRIHREKWEHAIWEYERGLRKAKVPEFKALDPLPPLPPRKVREPVDLYEKWSSAQHAEVSVKAGNARWKAAPFNGKPRQTYKAPVAQEGGTNPVAQYGGASKGIPGTWGSGQGALQLQESGRPVFVKLRDKNGEILEGLDPVQVRWKGGAERVATKQGDRILYPGSDKAPCSGSEERVPIVHTVEERTGKRGAYTVDVYRATCKGCGNVRDVPKKAVEECPADWEFPVHAQPKGAKIGYVDRGEIVVHGAVFRDRYDGKRIIATVKRDPGEMPRYGEKSAEVWDPVPDRPDAVYGRMESCAMAEVYANRDRVLGMDKHRTLIREALARRENIALPIYLAVEGGRIVEKRGRIEPLPTPKVDTSTAEGRAKDKVQTKVGARPVANGSIKGIIPLTDLEAYRLKREERAKRDAVPAKPMILCDAKKAPIRNMIAF